MKDGRRPYLVVLLEFQSTVNRNMHRRMRNYVGLPWLLPLVLYNGSERWTATGHGADDAARSMSATIQRTVASRSLQLFLPCEAANRLRGRKNSS